MRAALIALIFSPNAEFFPGGLRRHPPPPARVDPPRVRQRAVRSLGELRMYFQGHHPDPLGLDPCAGTIARAQAGDDRANYRVHRATSLAIPRLAPGLRYAKPADWVAVCRGVCRRPEREGARSTDRCRCGGGRGVDGWALTRSIKGRVAGNDLKEDIRGGGNRRQRRCDQVSPSAPRAALPAHGCAGARSRRPTDLPPRWQARRARPPHPAATTPREPHAGHRDARPPGGGYHHPLTSLCEPSRSHAV